MLLTVVLYKSIVKRFTALFFHKFYGSFCLITKPLSVTREILNLEMKRDKDVAMRLSDRCTWIFYSISRSDK